MPNVLDKYKPTYDLNSFKHSDYGIKQSALSGAAAMGFERRDILQAVESMQPKHFYKSMTSYNSEEDVPHLYRWGWRIS